MLPISLTLFLSPQPPTPPASLCVLIYSDNNRHDLKIKSWKASTFKALPTDTVPFGQVLPSEAKRSEDSVKWTHLSSVLAERGPETITQKKQPAWDSAE